MFEIYWILKITLIDAKLYQKINNTDNTKLEVTQR